MTIDLRSSITTLLLVTAAAACMSPPDDEAPAAAEQQLRGRDAVQLAAADFDSLRTADSGSVAAATDCVFVDWCNRPASIKPDIGTVCRLRTGCSFTNATVTECANDVAAVCGAPVDPWWFCRQGAACPP